MVRPARLRVEPSSDEVKIRINGQFGEFAAFMTRETAVALAADLNAAADAKG